MPLAERHVESRWLVYDVFCKVLILSACHANEWQPCKSTTTPPKKKNQEKVLNFVYVLIFKCGIIVYAML